MWRRLLILTTKRSREPIAALVWFLALTAWALHSPVTMTAQTLTTLYNFQGPPTDGMAPGTGVVRDHNGNMYGTTSAGGQSENGTAFEVDASGTEIMLHSFQFLVDGVNPESSLALGPGNALYGTTPLGGPNNAYGTVFRIRDNTVTVVYAFSGGLDGLAPVGGVVENIDGNLYGTTGGGGTGTCPGGCGTIYRIDRNRHESVLHNFDGPNGAHPGLATLIHDPQGNLYGTTSGGGLDDSDNMCPGGCGIVFMLSRSGKFTVLHKFTYGTSDGRFVEFGVVRDRNGNLYGTTLGGGTWNYGTIYEITNTGEEKVLYNVAGAPDGSDPGPIVIANGKLYGATTSGGQPTCWLSYGGCGVIFQFDKSGTEKVLYTFNGVTDGAVPVGPLTFDSEGNMYGATVQGMKDNCAFWQGGCGTIWKLSPPSQ
ncbi:MAG: choice-of-anchor tandem repeat GloVer-containing protein [Candidatus Sulfotelmatobacter sp.]